LRKLTSGYNSIIKNGVRLKNQRAALFIAAGKNKRALALETNYENFVCERLDQIIQANEVQIDIFISEFKKLKKTNKLISNLTTIPGIQERSAVKLLAIVIDPKRFENKGRWLSYCGLIKLEKMSGGRSYGKRNPQYSREAKSIFKVAALSCIIHGGPENPFRCYYEILRKKGIADHDARHAVARRIAVITLGVLLSNTPFKNNWKEQKEIIK
jgi:transposase